MNKKENQRHIPVRMCIATRKKLPKKDLLRFVYDEKSKNVVFDRDGKFMGRGANLSKSLLLFDSAKKNGEFNRAFKTKISTENFTSLRKEVAEYLDRSQQIINNSPKVVRIEGKGVKL